ncbi:MAG: hypothetical protein IIX68_06010 [Clostridia bacterium]|nr:hypothetical protein [Clostridia bacterium]
MARHGKVVRKNHTKAIVLSLCLGIVAIIAAVAVFLASNGAFASLLASVFPDKIYIAKYRIASTSILLAPA